MIDARAAAEYNGAMLPNDPFILLSAVNMKLRDSDLTLTEILDGEEASVEEITEKLAAIGYFYDEKRRTFRAL